MDEKKLNELYKVIKLSKWFVEEYVELFGECRHEDGVCVCTCEAKELLERINKVLE